MALASKKKRKARPGIENSLSATDACNLLQQSPSCSDTLRCVLKILLAGGREAESFSEDLLANGFLGLVPSILRHSRRKGVATGIEVLGAVSMASLTAHRKVVSDKNAICALAEILTKADVELLTLASHAVVDLLITPFGCESLKKSGVIDHLLRLLCWIGDLSQDAQKCLVDERYPSTSRVPGETDCDRREAGHPCDLLLSWKLSNDYGSTHGERKAVTFGMQGTDFCEEFEELVTTASTAISALIRHVGIKNSSRDLSQKVLKLLRRFWHTLLKKDQILRESTAADDEPKWTCNQGTRQLIAKCVVQLAMEVDSQCTNLSVQQGLFEKTNFNQKLFFGKYWEQSPMVLTRELPSCLSEMSQKLATLAGVVNNFLGWTVGCPRAIADQLDSLCLLESIESDLGEPMIYGRDIRMVKTELDAVCPPTETPDTTVEIHYNGTGPASASQVQRYVHPREVLEAVGKGYTVAIKGMELRCSSISDVADCLAKQCGQPSVGVNLYITPPNAQGLDLHYDDHCVFVCQLVGRKMWNVFPPQKLLPRLYSCRTLDRGALDDLAPTVYDLEEGDVLYIPRGFPHRARCQQQGVSRTCLPGLGECATDEPNIRQKCFSPAEELLRDEHGCKNLEDNTAEENSGSFGLEADQDSNILDFSPGLYSLHLTFGVEVEPPFEWEGLLHIALRLWTEQRWQIRATSRQSDSYATKESCNLYEEFCEGLLHIAINLLGEKEILLRKACMIAAECPPHSSSELREQATASPKAGSKVFVCEQGNPSVCSVCDPVSVEYFQKLLELVAHKACYKEAYGFAEDFSGDSIGSFPGVMQWLRHIPHPGGHGPTSLLDPITSVMNRLNEGKMLEVEVAFSNMKAEFGRALFFHQASEAFRSIHSQYRIMRRKFTDGMLALHESC